MASLNPRILEPPRAEACLEVEAKQEATLRVGKQAEDAWPPEGGLKRGKRKGAYACAVGPPAGGEINV